MGCCSLTFDVSWGESGTEKVCWNTGKVGLTDYDKQYIAIFFEVRPIHACTLVPLWANLGM